MKDSQVKELLLQALETELGGVQVYKTALECAVNSDLKKEWEKYLEQTEDHVRIARRVIEAFEIDPEQDSAGRRVVRHQGESLVRAMQMAREEGDDEAAQLVAAECVVLAETKDHDNWSLLKEVAEKTTDNRGRVLKEAVEEVEQQEDEHLYHTRGWLRELWIESLGMPAVLPPPEEEKDVKSAIGAEKAKNAREAML